MFNILEVFSQQKLKTFLDSHPFRKKIILKRIKKSQISFDEKYYILLKSRMHRRFWITEKHLIPVFVKFPDERRFSLVIEECPICGKEHYIHKEQIEILREKYPLLINDLEYIARRANYQAEQIYRQCLNSGKTRKVADDIFNSSYMEIAKQLTHDTERGKILIFPKSNSG